MEVIRKMIIIPDYKIKKKNENDPVHIAATKFLALYRTCERMHTLPEIGGLYDQDSLFVYLMQYTMKNEDDMRRKAERDAELKRAAQ